MADERLIPAGIRDASNLAMNELIDRMGTVDLTSLLIYIIDNVEKTALPHLIEQFHVAGYEGGALVASEADRRAIVKNAIEKHRYKGTRYAVDLALSSLGITYTLQEWFEYAGDPYHFRVAIDVMDSELPAATLTLLDAYINEYKNVRSILDTIEVNRSVSGNVPVMAIGLQSSEIITVYPQ